MRRRSTLGVGVAAALVAAGTAGLLVVASRRSSADVLTSSDEQTVFDTGRGSPGQVYTFGLQDVTNTSGHEVRFVDIRPVDPTPGLVIDAIRAIDNCGIRRGRIGMYVGTVEFKRPDLDPRPITDAVVAPHSASCWYFAVTAHADSLGTFECLAFDLVYRADGTTRVHRRHHGIRLVLDSPGPDSRATNRPSPLPVPLATPTG